MSRINLVVFVYDSFDNLNDVGYVPFEHIVGFYELSEVSKPYTPKLINLQVTKLLEFFDHTPYEKVWVAHNGNGKYCCQDLTESTEPDKDLFSDKSSYSSPDLESVFVNHFRF